MTKKKVRILCLDGGGIRGIVPATVMQYVEERLIALSGNRNARIADYFDMVVGTSTGAILGCFYLMPHAQKGAANTPNARYEAAEALRLYVEKGGEIFDDAKKHPWGGLRQLFNATRFSPKNIERIFNEAFGDTFFDALLKPCIVTTYDLHSQNSFFFNSRESAKRQSERKFLVRDVARSTSAAPTYFPPALIKNHGSEGNEMVNIDGGVFANNPAMCAYAEARKTNFDHLNIDKPTAEDMLILSIGTGSQKLDFGNYKKSGSWGVINWAKTIPDIMMDGGLGTVDYQTNLIFDTLSPENKTNYKRVDVPKRLRGLDDNNNTPLYKSDMSDASAENIRNLKIAGQEAIKEANVSETNKLSLDAFIQQLYDIDVLLQAEEAGDFA